ncbi:ABC transporter ATP-binding protein [Schnuerera sp. xch1]|uniref:ABC transporter ATP-binding protein n=1 Tax=Schnuerera sp. xch1 TaxID=2874283 RepID=UPI001CBA70C9|nr:ABC transporter ATP-binding protein [Schnuerera sp. xch1]MBZ2174652.1 ABC transporter ATP-binding protein [Schnuerera sp. xch1]
MKTIQTEKLILGYENTVIIDDISVKIPNNKISILIGANGCGKSTLLRSFARLLNPISGNIILNGRSMSKVSNKQIAKELAILPQTPVVSGSLTVRELVKMGRFPYQSWKNKLSDIDHEIVKKALKSTNMQNFADRNLNSLSGGQRQRAWIAMVLAQETDIILLDEPTTYLDVTYQIEVLDLLCKLNKEEGKTIVMVLHDLNLSCRYAHHIIALKDKKIYKQGAPQEVITKETVRDILDLECEIINDPIYKTPMCVPYSKAV